MIRAFIRLDHSGSSALLLGAFVFGLLWVVNSSYRQVYQPTHDDVTALADGLLLGPGAHWQQWFTRGFSDFFDAYPEWSLHETAFARPAFQFLIYLAHVVFGRDWASYLAINYLGIAGVSALAFVIARTALGLGSAAALLAAILVPTSSAVLEFSIGVLGTASETVASVLVAGAFLAVVARRDVLCLGLLLLALFTKETAAWAPIAAAITVLVRPEKVAGSRRAVTGATMLLPLAIWLGFRAMFFGGIGGTYATAGYTPLLEFLELSARKITHLHHLLVMQGDAAPAGGRGALDEGVRIAAGLLVFLLLAAWMLSGIRAAIDRIGRAVHERSWPVGEAPLLVSLWGVLGFAFYLALALSSARYAASAVLFTWPAIVGEVARHRSAVLRLSVAACLVLSLGRTSQLLAESNPPSNESDAGRFFQAAATLDAALSRVPATIDEVYVVSAGGLVPANPKYIEAFLGMHATLVRLIDISWECVADEGIVTAQHSVSDSEVTIDLRLPDCASRFFFAFSTTNTGALLEGPLRRGASIRYELPKDDAVGREDARSGHEAIRDVVVHIRPRGAARFIIEHGEPNGGLAFFDTHS